MAKLEQTKPLNMGRIGAAHGIKGSLRIKSYTENPLDLGKYGPLYDEKGRTYTIKNIRPQKTMVIVRFKEITSRNDAETLNGVELFVDQDKIPEIEQDDTFYIKDMVGMEVMDFDNELIGSIVDVPNFGAGDLLEISPKPVGGNAVEPTYFLAFTKSNVPEIDFERHLVKINPPVEINENDIKTDDDPDTPDLSDLPE